MTGPDSRPAPERQALEQVRSQMVVMPSSSAMRGPLRPQISIDICDDDDMYHREDSFVMPLQVDLDLTEDPEPFSTSVSSQDPDNAAQTTELDISADPEPMVFPVVIPSESPGARFQPLLSSPLASSPHTSSPMVSPRVQQLSPTQGRKLISSPLTIARKRMDLTALKSAKSFDF